MPAFKFGKNLANVNWKFFTFCCLLFVGITRGLNQRYFGLNGDAASYWDFLSHKTSNTPLISNFTLSSWDLYKYINSSMEAKLTTGLQPTMDGMSNIHWHAYLVTFLTLPLKSFLEASPIISLSFISLSYVLAFWFINKLFKQYKLPPYAIYFFCMVTLLWTNVNQSLIGQPYIDKIFFGPCVILILLLINNANNVDVIFWPVVLCSLLGLILSERTSLTSGWIVLFCILFFRFSELRNSRKLQIIFLFGLINTFWYFIWTQFIANSDYYSQLNFDGMINNIINLFNSRSSLAIIFAANLLPYFILAAVRLKLFTILLISITPNLVANVGGAELTGFSTHYHSLYTPVLVAISAFAVSEIYDKKRFLFFRLDSISLILPVSILLAIGVLANGLANNSYGLEDSFKQTLKSIGIVSNSNSSEYAIGANKIKYLKRFIGYNQGSVSAPESLNPSLLNYGFKEIHYFPVGVGYDDLIIAPYQLTNLGVPDVSIYGLVPKNQTLVWATEVQQRIEKRYELIDKVEFNGYLWKVYKKN